MIALSSSNLSGAEYENGTLYVEFHGGRLYAYYSVPYSEFTGLINARSHGEYHAAYIKGRYPYRRIR